jgi:hypothetical protein
LQVALSPSLTSLLSPDGSALDPRLLETDPRVLTRQPTGDLQTGVPYLLSYDVADAAGLRAATGRRRLYVLCRVGKSTHVYLK